MAHQHPSEDHDPLPLNPTAVGIDKDKHSHHAVKWAIDHLLTGEQFLILVHVNPRGSQNRRNFKKLDVPNTVSKSAPEFCSVYVVQKGKLMSVRSAQRPIINTVAPPKLPHASPHQLSIGNAQHGVLNALGSEKYLLENNSRRRPQGINRNNPATLSLDSYELSNKSRSSSSTRSSISDDDQEDQLGFGSIDMTSHNMDFSMPVARDEHRRGPGSVEVLCCMRHPNMVLLLGACPEYGCLVYEYMNNGSLEDRLARRGNTPPIPWRIRFKIAAEIVTALIFLHQAKPEPLVHRDLKPANILLDRNYVSKISDVGLARLVPPSVADSVTQYHMTAAAGTFCYIDPEYQQTGMLTTKSDVYSLGIMLLQIITARPPMGLSHHVKRAIERGSFESMLDPAVPDWPVEAALSFAKVALQCAELRKKDRPDLAKEVLPELLRLQDYGMEDGGDSTPAGFGGGWHSH